MRGMTAREREARKEVIDILIKDGYKTYAKILSKFSLNLTKDPTRIGYMIPGERVIVINEELDLDQVSVIVRHEILHEVFDHMQRHIDRFGKIQNQDEMTLSNIAGDYDISNNAYTDKDKMNIRQIRIYGAVLSGLVTEDQHPDWVNLSFEEMEEKLREEAKNKPEEPQQSQQKEQEENYSEEFIEAYNKVIEKYNKKEYSDITLKKLLQDLNNGKGIEL